MLVGQGRTQKNNNHPNGPVIEPQGDFEPGGPVDFGTEIVLTPINADDNLNNKRKAKYKSHSFILGIHLSRSEIHLDPYI